MKKTIRTLVLLFAMAASLSSCGLLDEKQSTPRNDTSIIPSTYNGRPTDDLGSVYLNDRDVTISVYDFGQIDGDIVSIIVNGETVISNYTLRGPSEPNTVNVKLKYDGFNYILLYAHNLGDIPPNTAAITITDGTGDSQDFSLNANLDANGAYNIIVN